MRWVGEVVIVIIVGRWDSVEGRLMGSSELGLSKGDRLLQSTRQQHEASLALTLLLA